MTLVKNSVSGNIDALTDRTAAKAAESHAVAHSTAGRIAFSSGFGSANGRSRHFPDTVTGATSDGKPAKNNDGDGITSDSAIQWRGKSAATVAGTTPAFENIESPLQ